MLVAAFVLEIATLGLATPLAVALGASAVAVLGLSVGGMTAAVRRSKLQENYLGALRFLSSELAHKNDAEKAACLQESDVLVLERKITTVRH